MTTLYFVQFFIYFCWFFVVFSLYTFFYWQPALLRARCQPGSLGRTEAATVAEPFARTQSNPLSVAAAASAAAVATLLLPCWAAAKLVWLWLWQRQLRHDGCGSGSSSSSSGSGSRSSYQNRLSTHFSGFSLVIAAAVLELFKGCKSKRGLLVCISGQSQRNFMARVREWERESVREGKGQKARVRERASEWVSERAQCERKRERAR